MKWNYFLAAGLTTFLACSPLLADKIRISAAEWSGNTRSEFMGRNAVELNDYDAITAAQIRSALAPMGMKLTGNPPVNYNRAPQTGRDSTAGPAGIEYWLTFGRSALILGYTAYSLNSSTDYTILGQTTQALNGTPVMTTTTMGAGQVGSYTTHASELSLGLRLPLTERFALIPHVSSLSLHRTIGSNAVWQETIESTTFPPVYYLENRNLAGTAKGSMVGLGFELNLTSAFAVLGDFASSPENLSGPYSETNLQTVLSQGNAPDYLITLSGDKMKVGVRRGMFGFQYTIANALHLRVGYLQEDQAVSYSGTPFQILIDPTTQTQTSADLLNLYPSDYRSILYREMGSHQAVKTDRKQGAFFGVSYDVDFGSTSNPAPNPAAGKDDSDR